MLCVPRGHLRGRGAPLGEADGEEQEARGAEAEGAGPPRARGAVQEAERRVELHPVQIRVALLADHARQGAHPPSGLPGLGRVSRASLSQAILRRPMDLQVQRYQPQEGQGAGAAGGCTPITARHAGAGAYSKVGPIYAKLPSSVEFKIQRIQMPSRKFQLNFLFRYKPTRKEGLHEAPVTRAAAARNFHKYMKILAFSPSNP